MAGLLIDVRAAEARGVDMSETQELANRLDALFNSYLEKRYRMGKMEFLEEVWDNKALVIAALRATPPAPVAMSEDVRALLREARQYVADAGSDEDGETQRHSSALLAEIDAALAALPKSAPDQRHEAADAIESINSLPRYRDDHTGMQPHENGEWLKRKDVLRVLEPLATRLREATVYCTEMTELESQCIAVAEEMERIADPFAR